MKKTFLLFAFFVTHLCFYCQGTKDSIEISEIIKEKFSKMHPNATAIKWRSTNSMFSIDSVRCPISADYTTGEKYGWTVFDTTGNYWYTQLHLPYDSLPLKTQKYFRNRYPRYIGQNQFWKMYHKYPKRKFYFYCYLQFILEQESCKEEKKYLLIYYRGEKGFIRVFDKEGNYLSKGPDNSF